MDYLEELRDLVEWMDDDLDGNVAEGYKTQPSAQHWARVAKIIEDAPFKLDHGPGVAASARASMASRSSIMPPLLSRSTARGR